MSFVARRMTVMLNVDRCFVAAELNGQAIGA